MAATIQSVKARQIFDSRGNPTVEVDVCCSDGTFARAAVPSGASTGVYEALELRDSGSDYLGKGVSKAVNNVNSIIAPALIGKDPTAQTELDNFMVQQLDGTKNEWGWCKQKLGANAILAVSLAVCKAGASVKKIPLYQHIADLAGNKQLVLPVPAFNAINGGSHAGNKLAMQEFMILPTGAALFKEAMKMGVDVYHNLKSVIKKYGQDATNVGDEGGFAPNIQENKEGLELLKTAIEKAGYTGKVVIGMDVAASEFYNDKDKTYDLNFKEENNDGSQKISGDSLKNVYKSFVSEYPIVSIEDPFDQDDWVHYAKMTEECGAQVQIVGDDLLVTYPTDAAFASTTVGLEASRLASPEMTFKRSQVLRNGRTFSSIGPEVPVVRQLLFCDDYQIQNETLVSLKKCLIGGTILTPISPAGLFRKEDLSKFGASVLGELGFWLLRHGSALVTVNLMRGRNVSQLLKMENILWSPEHRGIMFNKTSLTDGAESIECPYNALRKLFNQCLEVSTGQKLENVRKPLDLVHFLYYLKNANLVDKRLINNHSAIRLPGERIERNSMANRFLRQQVVYELKRRRSEDRQELEDCVNLVFLDLAEVFPHQLLESEGLHPVVDYWAREGQILCGASSTTSSTPVVLPLYSDGKKLKGRAESIELGRISVALHRDPFEHLFGPYQARVWKRDYNIYHVEELLNSVDPFYGPALEKSFMERGFWQELDMDKNKAPHCYWTD